MKTTVKKRISGGVGAIIGTVIMIILLLSMIGILSAMILNETVTESVSAIAIYFCVYVSAFAGCMTAMILAKDQKLIACLGTGGACVALLLMLHFILFSGGLTGVVGVLVAVICASASAYLLGNIKKGRGYKRVKKYRFG